MSSFTLESTEVRREAGKWWWLFLVTGTLWLIASLVIFRFDYLSVASISYLFGVVAIMFGVNDLFAMAGASTGWKIVRGLIGVLFIIAGIVAFAEPFGTFRSLAALIGFFLVLKGTFDIVVSFATKDDIPVWWLQLVIGIIELLLAFWAAGDFGRKAFILIVWIAAACMARGITEIIFAFKLHSLKKQGAL